MKLFKGNIVFTKKRESFDILENGFILEDKGIIIDIGFDLNKKYTNIEIEDYSGNLLIPGFVDLHFHAVQYGNLGIGLDEELLDWLNKYTFKEEEKFSDLEYAKYIFEKAISSIIRNGTTRIVFFSSIHEEASRLLIDMCIDKKIGAFVGKVNMDRNSPKRLTEDRIESLEISKKLLDISTKKVKSIITPRFVPTCSKELLDGLGELAKNNYPVQTHISENENEIEWVKKLHPESKNYLDVYDKANLLGNKTILAHCVYCNSEERKLLKERESFVAHCPSSNFNLTSGIMDIKSYMDQGINVGLGTDVGAGHKVSIKDTLVLAIQMSKVNKMYNKDKTILSFSEAFYLATKGGGKFFGKVGSFEKNYELDMLVVKPDELSEYKNDGIMEQLERFIYSGDDRMIMKRYCSGELL